jgi:hypothetical protein
MRYCYLPVLLLATFFAQPAPAEVKFDFPIVDYIKKHLPKFSGKGDEKAKPEPAPEAEQAPAPEDPYRAATYNRLTGQLHALLPGSIEDNVRNVETAVLKAKIHIIGKRVDGITANIKGRLADRRVFEIQLTGVEFKETAIAVRIPPSGIIDPKLVGGDEDGARMLLAYIRREAGLNADGRRKKWFFF